MKKSELRQIIKEEVKRLNELGGIRPNDKLETGARVQVGNKYGNVVSYEVEKDQFGSPITVHMIHFDSVFSHKGARTAKNPDGMYYKPYDKTSRVNYASINVLNKK